MGQRRRALHGWGGPWREEEPGSGCQVGFNPPSPGHSRVLRLVPSKQQMQIHTAPLAQLELTPGEGKHSPCNMMSSSFVLICAWTQCKPAGLPVQL